MQKNGRAETLNEFLEDIKGAMLQNYYVNVKNRIMQTDESINPFQDTIQTFLENKKVTEGLARFGIKKEDHYYRRMALVGTLKKAIMEN